MSPPTLHVWGNNQAVPASGSPLVPHVTLRVSPAAPCPPFVRYRFRNAELSLMREGQPVVPARRVSQPTVDLTAWMRVAHAGDRITIFIAYHNLLEVSADGTRQLYQPPASTPSPSKQVSGRTEQAKGIRFTWVITPNQASSRLPTP